MFNFIALFVLMIVMVYFAIMYENVAIMLVAYLLVIYFAVGFLSLFRAKRILRGKLYIPIGVSEVGKENLIRIMVTYSGLLPVLRLKAHISVEDTLSGHMEKGWMKLSGIARGENSFSKSLILPMAGNYEVSLRTLRLFDCTGLLYWDVKVDSTGQIQILPELHQVMVRLTMAVKNFYGESDVYDEHTPGHDKSEMLKVREYQVGDRLQNVHWKLTAKSDKFMVKEGSLPKSCPVVLLLDVHPQPRTRRMENALSYVEAAASLSYSLVDAGCSHYVAWYDETLKDVRRVRVEDEESLFYFISVLMSIRWTKSVEDIGERYKEMYRLEPFVYGLSLDENLVLKKGENVVTQFSGDDLKTALSQFELLL